MQLLGIEHWAQIKVKIGYGLDKRFMMGPAAMQAAREFLHAGKIVRIAADGSVGTGGSRLSFWGRDYTFRHGFAHLALDTGAPALPVIATLESSGKVEVEFFAPLDSGGEGERRDARIERLVTQYVRFLENMWAQHPGNVTKAHLHAFLASRPIQEEPDEV